MTSKYPEKEPIFCSFLPGLSFEGTNAVTPPLVAPRHSSASADFYREQDSNPDQAEREAAEDDEGGDEEEDLEEKVPSPIRTFTKVV